MDQNENSLAIDEYELASANLTTPIFTFSEREMDSETVNEESDRRERVAKSRAAEANAARLEAENSLRNKVGTTALYLVIGQLVFCDVLMTAYVIWSLVAGKTIPPEVLIGWMGSCLVEIVGILWVIARSLFPFRDSFRDTTGEEHRKA